MAPEAVIVQALQSYDNKLYVLWNNAKKYFEIWRKCEKQNFLITPVTRSIYDPDLPKEFTALDQRILWWLFAADSWRDKSIKEHAYLRDVKYLEFEAGLRKKAKADLRDRAKDLWRIMNNRYMAEYDTQNRSSVGKYPLFNNNKPKTKWIPPDVKATLSKRIFSR